MATDNDKKLKEDNQKTPSLPPDPETLHKTDPQENMEGPISSMMQGLKKDGEKNDEQSRSEADRKKEEGM